MGDGLDLYAFTEGLAEGELVPFTPDSAHTPEAPRGDCLLGVLGISLTHIGRGRAVAGLTVAKEHLNQRGLVQGGTIVALADAAAGWASYSSLAHGAFTTVDLSVVFLRAARDGDTLVARASPVRLGRRVQVFDVSVEAVRDARSGTAQDAAAGFSPEATAPCPGRRSVARITCTQLVLEPRTGQGPATDRESEAPHRVEA
jgi:uncharacterized protein (TIGR00369 family)